MQALLLATDERRALPPLTETLPGPLVPIIDRPVMATSIEVLARAGQKKILVSLFDRGGQIASYFGDGRRWGVEITYLTQRQALGSAGALRFAGGLLSESFLVLPGGALIDLDIEAALSFHRAHGGLVTAIVHGAPWGGAAQLRVAPDGHVLGPTEDAAEACTMSVTGAYIFEPGALAYIPRGEYADIVGNMLPAMLAAGEQIHCYTMRGYWNPLEGVVAFQEAQEVYLYSAYRQRTPEQDVGGPAETVRFPTLEGRAVAPGIWVGHNHSIHPSVRIAAPTYIGANSWIGREVELGPCTVIGPNVVIDEEATVSGSTVLGHTYVGRLVHISGRVVTASTLSDVQTGEATRVVDPFLIGSVNAPSGGRGAINRAASAITALALLALLSPVMALVGLLSLLATGGVIVREPRLGQRSKDSAALRVFRITRFRTRRASGDLPALGRLLERWELHRLPELVNVLRGEMALVGVKPLTPEEAAELTEEWQQRRHERPAGFTGLWYLQTSQESPLDAVIVADVYYAATRTWRGDVSYLLRTPGAWLRRARARRKPRSEREYLAQAG
jgi:NDP-sugar pyrophosphorylase family protein/lipopolysaccharide/colanic/teichoic acid biosynthesis glycosyltransferase